MLLWGSGWALPTETPQPEPKAAAAPVPPEPEQPLPGSLSTAIQLEDFPNKTFLSHRSLSSVRFVISRNSSHPRLWVLGSSCSWHQQRWLILEPRALQAPPWGCPTASRGSLKGSITFQVVKAPNTDRAGAGFYPALGSDPEGDTGCGRCCSMGRYPAWGSPGRGATHGKCCGNIHQDQRARGSPCTWAQGLCHHGHHGQVPWQPQSRCHLPWLPAQWGRAGTAAQKHWNEQRGTETFPDHHPKCAVPAASPPGCRSMVP